MKTLFVRNWKGHIFKAEIHLGQTDDGNYIAIHDSQRLKFCFLAESEKSVLKKVDKALSLYVKYKLSPLGKIKAERVDPLAKIQTNRRSIVREIDYEAIA